MGDFGIAELFKNAAKKIVYKLIHAEENAELLEQIPHVCVLDLAIVFYVLLDVSKSGTATILITDDIVKMWGVEKEKIYNIAHQKHEKNSCRRNFKQCTPWWLNCLAKRQTMKRKKILCMC